MSALLSARKERGKMKKDIKEKRLEEHNDVFADIFNILLFDGNSILEEENLTSLPTESYVREVDGEIHEEHRDVRKVDKDNHEYRLLCGIENQTGVDNTMPERVMGYDYAAYEFQIKEIMKANKNKKKHAFTKRIHDNQRLAPVVTAVLHWGDKDWDGPLRLHDMLEFSQETAEVIRPLVPDYPINLVEVRNIPKEIREKLKSDFRLIAEYAARRQDPEQLEELMSDKVHTIKHPEEFLDLLSEVTNDKRYKNAKEKLLKKEENVTMCVIAEKLEKRGIEQGIERGLNLVSELTLKLNEDGRLNDLVKAAMDSEYQHKLLREYNLY